MSIGEGARTSLVEEPAQSNIGEGARSTVQADLPPSAIGEGARSTVQEPLPPSQIGSGARSTEVVAGQAAAGNVDKNVISGGARNSVTEDPPPPSNIGEGARNTQQELPPPSNIGEGARNTQQEAPAVQSEEEPQGFQEGISDGARLSVRPDGTVRTSGRDSHILREDPTLALFQVPDGHVDTTSSVKRARMVLRKSALANSDNLLEREVLKEVIDENHRRWIGCLMLPITILFFIFYSMAVSLHEDTTYAYLVESPVRDALTPGIDDEEPYPSPLTLQGVSTIDELWYFIEHTFLPFFCQQQDSFGRPLPREQWGTFQRYNKVLGSVVFELARSEKVKCQEDDPKAPEGHMWCYPASTQDDKNFGLPLEELPPLPSGKTYFDPDGPPENNILACADEGFTADGCGGDEDEDRRLFVVREELQSKFPVNKGETFQFLFDTNSSYAELKERLYYLRNRGWLNEQAKNLKLKLVVLNTQIAKPRLEMVSVDVYFTRGGGLYTRLMMECFSLYGFTYVTSYLVDFCFFVMLMTSSVYMVQKFTSDWRRGELRQHFDGVNVITHATCFAGWVTGLAIAYQEIWRGSVKTAFIDFSDAPTQQNNLEMLEQVDKYKAFSQWLRVMNADFHILFMARCFIFLQWQPRLAVVTETLKATSTDLFHYLIVLIPTFFGFAIAGMMMFGRRVQEFATIDGAVAICFKIAMENEFDWGTLSDEHYWTAATWVWVYLLLVVMLLLNMVLAIIMDVYQEVRTHCGDSMTIFEHVLYLYRCFSQRKCWVSDQQLLEQVSEMPQIVLVAELKQAFPDMHHFQLDYLVSQTFNKALAISRVGINQRYTQQMVAAIHIGLEEALRDLTELADRGWMGKGIEVRADQDRELVKEIMTSIAVQSHWMGLTAKHITTLTGRLTPSSGEDDEMTQRIKKNATKSKAYQ